MPIFDNSGVVKDPNQKTNDIFVPGQNTDITKTTKTDIVESKGNNMLLYVLGALAAYYFLIKKK
jgi:hypothetical protein